MASPGHWAEGTGAPNSVSVKTLSMAQLLSRLL